MRRIIRLFKRGNVQVFGLRGSGKDMLMSNVAVRRKLPYVSNVDYGGQWLPLELDKLDIRNTHDNFINDDVVKYEHPYPDGTDVYISDCGIYFPSQYQGELCKKYPSFPFAMALSRQTGAYNVHTNSQAIQRVWDKIREQGDIYVRCVSCFVIGKLVVQHVIVYDRYDSAVAKVPPFPLSRPLCNPDRLQQWDIQRSNYLISYGDVKPMMLVYFNRSKYDTRRFKEVLKNGKEV